MKPDTTASLPARDELSSAAGAFLTIAGIMAGHTLLETARDALFLADISPTHLPWVYVAVAVGAVAMLRLQRACKRYESRKVLALMLLASGVMTMAFWMVVAALGKASLYALYVWSGVYSTVVVIQFWSLVNSSYTVVQAKRVYGFIGAGGVVGAIAGAALGRALVESFHARDLLLAAGLLLVASGVAPLVGLKPGDVQPCERDGVAAPLRPIEQLLAIGRDPYLGRLGALILLASVVLTLIDYLFLSTVAAGIAPAQLAPFFATVNVVLNVLALLAQLVAVPFLLKRMGVSRLLLVLPSLLFVGGLSLAAGGGLIAALVLIGAEGSLRHTLHRTATELLYVPISGEARSRAKGFIDALGHRGGQAIASIIILAISWWAASQLVLSITLTVCALVWVVLAAKLKRHYLDVFRQTLATRKLRTEVDMPPLDLASLESLIASLNSTSDDEVLGALELLEAEGRVALVPALLLYHPSRRVVVRAFELFEEAGRVDFTDIADRLLAHGDPEVRAAALRALAATPNGERRLRSALQEPSAMVRATAVVGLVARGSLDGGTDLLEELTRAGSLEAKDAFAREIRRKPLQLFVPALLELSQSNETELRTSVARAMGAVGNSQFLPVLAEMLASRDVRPVARSALVAMGTAALTFLQRALSDVAMPHEIRSHVPRTISLFRPVEAARILLERLPLERDITVQLKILRALGRLRSDNPGLRLVAEPLQRATAETINEGFRLLDWRSSIEKGELAERGSTPPGKALLLGLLRDKERQAIERLFRLLGLQHGGEDFEKIHAGLRSDEAVARASSTELLEHTLPAPQRHAILGLTGDGDDRKRLALASPYYEASERDYEATLRTMLEEGSDSVKCLTAYHIAELGMERLRPNLERMKLQSDTVGEVVERAIEMLTRRPHEVMSNAPAE